VATRNNLLGHGKLPFRITLRIPIRSWLKYDIKTIVTRILAIRWVTMPRRKGRSHHIEEEDTSEEEGKLEEASGI
jgi:hypothetical protein